MLGPSHPRGKSTFQILPCQVLSSQPIRFPTKIFLDGFTHADVVMIKYIPYKIYASGTDWKNLPVVLNLKFQLL